MTKQEKFEQAYAEAHGMPVETFQAYRMGDTYRLPMIAKCWRFWNMAIDSVVVELPSLRVAETYAQLHSFGPEDLAGAYRSSQLDCHSAIERAGVKVKS